MKKFSVNLNSPVKPNLRQLHKYLDVINKSGVFSNFGPLHSELTEKLSNYFGIKNLLLVSNGTVALQLAAKVLDSNNIISTPFSFIATASSMLWQSNKISFSDIDEYTFNLCPNKIKKILSKKNKFDTILATHVFGNPCDVEEFKNLSKFYNKKIIYDAAHSFGVNFKNNSILKYGDASTLSFHATKIFHTVEGGAVIFKKKENLLKAKNLINFGIKKNGYESVPGINGKLNEYQCAVGLVLFNDIDSILSRRAEIYDRYSKSLEGFVQLQRWFRHSNKNGSYFPIVLQSERIRNKVIKFLSSKNIQSRPYFYPSLNKIFDKKKIYENPTSEKIADRIICLPLHYYMNNAEIDYVCKNVLAAIEN